MIQGGNAKRHCCFLIYGGVNIDKCTDNNYGRSCPHRINWSFYSRMEAFQMGGSSEGAGPRGCARRGKFDKEIARVEKKFEKEISGVKTTHINDQSGIQEEQTLVIYGLLACLKGLAEQGCDGPVSEAIERIEKHINKKAHNQKRRD